MNSKKIISILLIMSLATSLMACSNTETVESSAIVSETVVEDEPIDVIITEGDPYSISAMQDVDVVDLILGFSSVAPNESFTSYPERFAVAPMTSEWLDFTDNVDSDRGYYEYAFNCADGDTDVISAVTLSSIWITSIQDPCERSSSITINIGVSRHFKSAFVASYKRCKKVFTPSVFSSCSFST